MTNRGGVEFEKMAEIARKQRDEIAKKRTDNRICKANKIASDEDVNFTKLTAFAKEHPMVWKDIYQAFQERPDIRFGDTLLMFCDSVKYGQIVLSS